MNKERRDFIKKAAIGATALSVGGVLPGFSAKSYGDIIGSNDRINVAAMGVNARGFAVANNFARQENCRVTHVCDVDFRASQKSIDSVEKIQGKRPKDTRDFRKALDDKQLDALIVTAPDHWHAPAAILACSAGKHVYLEKPASHNPHEGELVIQAAKKYNRVIQMGNQRRSWPNVVKGIQEVHSGAIGRPYFAKTWYSNNRGPIGVGKEVAVPDWLDYELWQGPAPRRPYKDNVIHYNWHWFWHWGTGEALNNGTHMVDLARWGLQVEYPTRVTSAGGRYRYQDDWETPDTQVITLDFENNTTISWEGRSCNGTPVEGSSVGVIFYGESGSLFIGAGNAYTIFDLNGKVVKEVANDITIDARNPVNPSSQLDAFHMVNFLEGIRRGEKQNADIVGGHQSTLLVQLGNIAQRCGQSLNIDPKNGHILNNKEAMKYWTREYEPGWEPKV
jgi:predicted dehydrogenase